MNGLRLLLVSCAVLGVLGCNDDDAKDGSDAKKRSDAHETSGESEKPSGPLFAVMYEVFNDDESDSYLSVFDSLDIEQIDTSKSREFAGGRAYLRAYDGGVFVGEPAAPTIRRFELDEAGELVEKGKLSLGNYGIMDGSIDDWVVNFINPTKAYYFNARDGLTILWNPKTMEVLGEIAPPDGYLRKGFSPNTSTAVLRGDKLYRSVYWLVEDSVERSGDQMLLVYDTEADELASATMDTRCASADNRAFKAEDGTLYFSNWIWAVSDTLLFGAQKNCVLRVQPDADAFDPEWSLEFAEFAGGREGGMFTYVEDGKAIASIFHDEDATREDDTDPYDYAGQMQWEIWNVDVNERTGAPLEGIPRNSGAYTPVKIDGRDFLMIPSEDWSDTQLYELRDGGAKAGLKIPGWSYMFTKIRD